MAIVKNPGPDPQPSEPLANAKAPAKRIFIVEDEEMVADDLEEMLGHLGYDVVGQAATGEETILEVPKIRPDLVLMDLQLKGKLDGVETAQILSNTHVDTPVIYLTAHNDEAAVIRMQATGPFGYICKPFEERELGLVIEIALYRNAAEAKLKKLNQELRAALTEIETLCSLLPICSWCKKVLNERGEWEKLENYVTTHSRSQLTHSICPKCADDFRISHG